MVAARYVVLVCGGRNYANKTTLYGVLDAIHENRPITLLVEGGAEGADKLAGRWAMERGVPRVTVWANWEGEGKSAGPNRNKRMINLLEPDEVIAFSGGKGTRNMISTAKLAGVQVTEVAYDAG